MSQHHQISGIPSQPQLTAPIPINVLSYADADRPNHAGKPLWNHLKSKDSNTSYVVFQEDGIRRPVLKIFHEGKLHTGISLDQLLLCADVDRRAGLLNDARDGKLNLVVKKPLFAIKYVDEAGVIKRFQINFKDGGDGGFELVCEMFKRHGLTLKETNSSDQASQLSSDLRLTTIPKKPSALSSPTYPSSSLAISQAPIHREDIPHIPHQGQVQNRPTALPSYDYQSHQAAYGSERVINWQPGLSHGSDPTFRPSAELVSKQMLGSDLASYVDGFASEQLTSRPVKRMLSYSTLPSLQQQAKMSAQGLSDIPHRSDIGQSQFPGQQQANIPLSLPALQSSPLDRVQGFSTVQARPFFQRPGTSTNLSRFCFAAKLAPTTMESLGTERHSAEEVWRPATAPAYLGIPQHSATLDSYDPRPPKMILPFPSAHKPNKPRVEEMDVEGLENLNEAEERRLEVDKQEDKRPTTSPAVLTQPRKSRKPPQPKKSLKREATVKKNADQGNEPAPKVPKSQIAEKAKPAPKRRNTGRKVFNGEPAAPPTVQTVEQAHEATVQTSILAAHIDQIPNTSDTDAIVGKTAEFQSQNRPPSSSDESSRACEGCRKRRTKCDKVVPECTRCRKAGRVCEYGSAIENKRRDSRQASDKTSSQSEVMISSVEDPAVQYADVGTQAILMSFHAPRTRTQATQASPGTLDASSANAQRVSVVNELQEAVEKIIQETRQTTTQTSLVGPAMLDSNATSAGTMRAERDTAFEQMVCEFLLADDCIPFCEEVERICKKTGITTTRAI